MVEFNTMDPGESVQIRYNAIVHTIFCIAHIGSCVSILNQYMQYNAYKMCTFPLVVRNGRRK